LPQTLAVAEEIHPTSQKYHTGFSPNMKGNDYYLYADVSTGFLLIKTSKFLNQGILFLVYFPYFEKIRICLRNHHKLEGGNDCEILVDSHVFAPS
jgi:hypothetical protein